MMNVDHLYKRCLFKYVVDVQIPSEFKIYKVIVAL